MKTRQVEVLGIDIIHKNVLPLPTQVKHVLNSVKAFDSHHTVKADELPGKVKQNRRSSNPFALRVRFKARIGI